MSVIQADIINTLGDAMIAMSAYAGGSVPASTDSAYANWKRWLALGQLDAAKRGFWARTLTPVEVAITANDNEVNLPDDFFKRNGIYVFNVNGVDWNSNNNSDRQKLMVRRELQGTTTKTAKWVCRFTGFTPTENATATLWYFAAPPTPVDEADPFILDGEMIMFAGLKEYFRQARQPGSQDDARTEYENRFLENLNLEMLPTPQELMSWGSVYDHNGISPMDEVHRSSFNKTKY